MVMVLPAAVVMWLWSMWWWFSQGKAEQDENSPKGEHLIVAELPGQRVVRNETVPCVHQGLGVAGVLPKVGL